MGMNDTPRSNRVHIGFFGRRNAGKSSLVNAVTGQDLAVVSEIKGTTTDPVFKSMELLPLGPVLIIDTPGIDDSGSLGEKRVLKTRQILNKTDAAVLVTDAAEPVLEIAEAELLSLLKEKHIPFIIARNKCDLVPVPRRPADSPDRELFVSAKTGEGVAELKERLAVLTQSGETKLRILGDLLRPGDFVVLVTPIDSAAPKGRMILPQQQTIRDALEADGTAVVVKENGLAETLACLGKKPALVVTDSQAFDQVSAAVPPDIPLTSFSILFARLKGFLLPAVRGVRALDGIGDHQKILVCEGCTHHRQCDDIGTVKLPRWIREYTGKEPEFVFHSGGDFPEDLSPYALVLHCGACMLNEKEMEYRRDRAAAQGAPFTNYGVTIAHIKGILRRSLELFPEALAELEPPR
ncbi:MAG: [FeFe] hydrogenase H-cluster maturation GTPase HydF, partial [Treponema sp.]|nr:[FeFe] hydrogenase H-cluster maturation GTPase HydF [Treponema sp.]